MHLKAILIVLVGVPVCAAILTAFPTFFLMSQQEGPPLTRADLIQGSIFCLGAIIVVALSVVAFMRIRSGRRSEVGFLPMLVPVLVLAGIVGGGLFARKVGGSRRETNDRHDAELCDEPAFWGVDEATCLDRSRTCRMASRGARAR